MRRGRFIQSGFFTENPIAALSNNFIEKAARNFFEKPGSSGIKPGKHFLNGPGAPKNPPFMEKHKIFQVRSILRFQRLSGRDPLKGGIEKLPPDVPFPHKIDKGIAKITNPVKKNNCRFSFLRHTSFIKPFKVFCPVSFEILRHCGGTESAQGLAEIDPEQLIPILFIPV